MADYDYTSGIIPFEAHRLAHEAGFVLQAWDEDTYFFIKSRLGEDQLTVAVVGLADGGGLTGDPDEPEWTVWKHRHGRDGSITSRIMDGATLKDVFEKYHLLPEPRLDSDLTFQPVQTWEELEAPASTPTR